MGVLLVLGFVFTSIISRNITQSSRSQQRTVASDLAESGIRFAHSQLQNSSLGADWRPDATLPAIDAGGVTRDPDALYLRPGTGFGLRSDADNVIDRGGPDGLGPYARVEFDRGRAMVRVRYAPADFAAFGAPSGNLRQPGRARHYLVLESIGRSGKFTPRDPSGLLAKGVQITNFGAGGSAAFRNALGSLKQVDGQVRESRRLIAFTPLGLTDQARFITNKFRLSSPAEIGSLTAAGAGRDREGLGVTYKNDPVVLASQYGGQVRNASGGLVTTGTGSLWSNADLVVHGRQDVTLNSAIGDQWAIAGTVRGANGNAVVNMTPILANGLPGAVISLNGGRLDSNSRGFSTVNGLFRDGVQEADADGFSRSVARRDPPSILVNEPSTGLNRYLILTRDSGRIGNRGNTGRFGHGSGVYVDSRERGNFATEEEREQAGVGRSLMDDWLNPNNPSSRAWRGPFYTPLAAYVRFLPDGFEIIRDSQSRQRFWRTEDGQPTSTSRARFRIRRVSVSGVPQTFILNSIRTPQLAELPGAQLTDSDFLNNGRPFNGVVLFEGDVRVRGVIPTHQQVSLVSFGTIYIDGSVVKGTVLENGQTITEPSRSALALMAKDYVTINPTQFFAPAPGETANPKNADPLPNAPSPIELDLSESSNLQLVTQFVLDPVGTGAGSGTQPGNPGTWEPYANTYREAGSGRAIATTMLLTHAADDGGPAFIQMDILPQSYSDISSPTARPYLFGRSATFNFAAGAAFAGTGNIPIYGLANPAVNAYPRFETISLPLANNTFTGTRKISGAGAGFGDYELAIQDETRFFFRLTGLAGYTPKNYAMARVAVQPHDVRIEATIYAEEGSFFVIPGPAFNLNPDDSREAYASRVTSIGLPAAQQERYARYGTLPETPFYGEPLNDRIVIVGAVNENMPPPIAVQAAWQRVWGWMPDEIGGTGQRLPAQHVPSTVDLTTQRYVPNLIINYDPMLALASADGVNPVRTTSDGQWNLPPLPRLPVSPTLAYFGEVNP